MRSDRRSRFQAWSRVWLLLRGRSSPGETTIVRARLDPPTVSAEEVEAAKARREILLAEWKDVRESLRYFGNKRFAQITVFVAANGFLFNAVYKQIRNVASLPVVGPHVAIMPDCHWGMGATVGSVIPTRHAIIPVAVGVDLGCGMMAIHTDLSVNDLEPLSLLIARAPPGSRGGKNIRVPTFESTLGAVAPSRVKIAPS